MSNGSTQWHRFVTAGVIPRPHLPGFLAGSAGEQESIRSVVTYQQSAEILAAGFGRCVTPNNKLLLLGELYLDPCAAAPAV